MTKETKIRERKKESSLTRDMDIDHMKRKRETHSE